MTTQNTPHFSVRLAETEADLVAAQRLRYEVFVEELGGTGEMVDHEERVERDRFDAYCDHLILTDHLRDEVVGVYRVMRQDQAERAGGFYSAAEYDLSPLLRIQRPILELGRSCLRSDYRGGMAMYHLWSALAAYVSRHEIEILFGVASFHGTDVDSLAAPLSLLHHRHLAPAEIRVKAQPESFSPMNLLEEDSFDRRDAMRQMPSLIKAYLRLGGCVGEGAFVDHSFNTTDVCLILDTAKMNQSQARLYQGQGV